MEDRPDDHVLVERAVAGEGASFRLLVVRYQKLVASVAWRNGIVGEEIEDLVSEVFLKVYRNLGRYRPDHPFSTWLYRLALNHVVDRRRRTRREPARAEMPEQVASSGASPGQELLRDERAELLRDALGSIDARYRHALTLVYVEGLKVEEAARILEVPEGTVKTRLMRGREALRRLLARRHPGYFES
jgi:RNA polymerase sigma-70 factor (ECF subfamily)